MPASFSAHSITVFLKDAHLLGKFALRVRPRAAVSVIDQDVCTPPRGRVTSAEGEEALSTGRSFVIGPLRFIMAEGCLHML